MNPRAVSLAFVLSLMAIVPGAARADLIIDDFNNVTSFQVFNPPGFGSTSVPASPPVFSRDYAINIIAGGSVVDGAKWTTSGPANFSTDAGVQAVHQLGYGDFLLGSALGLDLSAFAQFEFDARADSAVAAEFTVDGITFAFVIPGSGIGVFTHFVVPFSFFSPFVDFSNLGGFGFTLSGASNGSEVDGQFDNFKASVPEPASVAVFGFALIGVVGTVIRRRRDRSVS